MAYVTFYEKFDYKGKRRTCNIDNEDFYHILVYENAKEPILIRSIVNKTNFFITLYYKKDSNAFGGNYIYIKENLSDIREVKNEDLFGWSKGVSPEFNGIVLQKLLPDRRYEFNTVLSTWYSEQPYGNDVLDMRHSLKESDEPKESNLFTTLFIDPLMARTANSNVQPMRSERTCKEINERLNKLINIMSEQYDGCKKHLLKLDSQELQLKKEIQDLEQSNQRFKTFKESNQLDEEVKDKDITNNKDLTYLYFLIIIDLFMLFYILYKHKDYFVGMK